MMQTCSFSRGLRAALAGLCLVLVSSAALAGNVGGNSSNSSNTGGNGSTSAGGPTDDIGTMPVRADVFGLTFVGTPSELRSLDARVAGQGRIAVASLPSGALVVTFVGDYRIDLDRAALARSHVAVLFRSGSTFTDGRARLALGDSSSAFLAPARLPLPLARLAESPRVQGGFLTLDMLGTSGLSEHLAADFGAERVTLFQRLR